MRLRFSLVFTAFVAIALARPLRAAEPSARELWFYYPTNLQVDENVDRLTPIWRRAAAAGYTKVLFGDSKLSRLGDLQGNEKRYFANVKRLRALADELHIQIVPGVIDVGYSNAQLWHDPNLAEGVPVRDALFVVRDDGTSATIEADPPVALNELLFKDDVVRLANEKGDLLPAKAKFKSFDDGSQAVIADPTGNARLSFHVKVSPFRCYHVGLKIKTTDFTGSPRIGVLGGPKGRELQHQDLGVKRTQDWTQHDVVFDSLDQADVKVYVGQWGDAKGELRIRDLKIEEAGLVNVLRSKGTPCTVLADGSRKALVEGVGYQKIEDPHMGREPYAGEYTAWHAQPPIKLIKPLTKGTKLRASWFYPPIIQEGQVSMCPSEAGTLDIWRDQLKRVGEAFDSRGYMMQFDEIRVLGWDDACAATAKKAPAAGPAGAVLAAAAREATKIVQATNAPGGKSPDAYTWSDMFDPFHNAHDNYYLVNGDLAGSWEGLSPSTIIVNWNFEKRDQSLKFFADRGHRQVIAAYYDGQVNKTRQWLDSAAKVPNVVGVMYTTWKNKYDDLEAFAKTAKE